jgi:hypothetical protein
MKGALQLALYFTQTIPTFILIVHDFFQTWICR